MGWRSQNKYYSRLLPHLPMVSSLMHASPVQYIREKKKTRFCDTCDLIYYIIISSSFSMFGWLSPIHVASGSRLHILHRKSALDLQKQTHAIFQEYPSPLVLCLLVLLSNQLMRTTRVSQHSSVKNPRMLAFSIATSAKHFCIVKRLFHYSPTCTHKHVISTCKHFAASS